MVPMNMADQRQEFVFEQHTPSTHWAKREHKNKLPLRVQSSLEKRSRTWGSINVKWRGSFKKKDVNMTRTRARERERANSSTIGIWGAPVMLFVGRRMRALFTWQDIDINICCLLCLGTLTLAALFTFHHNGNGQDVGEERDDSRRTAKSGRRKAS